MIYHKDIELGFYISKLLKYWKHIIAFFLLCISISAIVANFILTPVYEAKTTLIIGTSNQLESSQLDPGNLLVSLDTLKDYLLLIKSRASIRSAIQKLNLHMSIEELEKNISIQLLKDTRIVELKIYHNDPVLAKNITNALVESSRETLRKVVGNMNIFVIDEGHVNFTPVQPKPIFIITMAGTLSIFICLFIVFLLVYFNDTLKTLDDYKDRLKLPVIGIVPKGNLINSGFSTEACSGTGNAYRMLYASFYVNGLSKGNNRIFGITDFYNESNKGDYILNLGLLLQYANKRILIIDADIKNPVLHECLKLPNKKGFLNVMFNNEHYKICMQKAKSGIDVITSGTLPDNSSITLCQERFEDFMGKITNEYDIVLINMPSIAVDSNAFIISMQVDSILIISNPGTVNVIEATRAIDLLRLTETKIMGVVIEDSNWKPGRKIKLNL